MTIRHIIALILLGGVFVMEGFDIAAMGIAVPRLEEALGLSPASFGWVFTGILVGLGVGGATIAPLGDRFGRRALIVTGCLATGLFTLATSTAETTTAFLLWRFLTGFALGACLPNVSALSSEIAPARLRATIMAVVSAGIPLGLFIAGVLAPAVIAAWGWHGLFYVPGVFAVVLTVMLALVLDGGAPASAGQPRKAGAKLPQLTLFSSPWLLPFAVFATILGLNALNLYLLNSWMPTVLPEFNLSMDDAAQIAGVANLAGLVIGIGASALVDNWRKGPALMLLFGSMALSFIAISLVDTETLQIVVTRPIDLGLLTIPELNVLAWLLMVGVGGANAGGMVLPGLAAHLFPARMLSSAVGMGVLVARLGAFAGPPLGAAMIAADVPARTFLGVAAIPALACVVVAFGVAAALRVKGREEPDEAAA